MNGPITRYFCPLECGWHYDQTPPTPGEGLPAPLAQRSDESFPDLVTRAAGETVRAHMQKADDALREHLDTHTVLQAATKAAEFREERDGARAIRGPLRDRLAAIVADELPEPSPVLVQRLADLIDEARIRARQDALHRVTKK
ncbi:hypothetical protein [Streptomyces sp. NPDC047868]|uniref:hypothetical protein n=1 Tax=Streptomyces sp. NPDC047868 TaxID=3155480 RepID=UPI00345312EF